MAGHVAQLFHNEIWAPRRQDVPGSTIHDMDDAEALASFFRRALFGLDVASVTLRTIDGKAIFTTNTAGRESRLEVATAFDQVRTGRPASTLVTNDADERGSRDLVLAYYALMDVAPGSGHGGRVGGVFSIQQDVTESLAAVRSDGLRNALISSLWPAGVLAVWLLPIVTAAEGAIRRGYAPLIEARDESRRRTEQLEAEVIQRQRAEETLAERTAALETANGELEAFA